MSINFFTTATAGYEHFVLPYIFSILHHVPDSFVEIAVDNADKFNEIYYEKLRVLYFYGYRNFLIRQIDDFKDRVFTNNTKRFLMAPERRADVYYIGDVDIFIFDDCIEQFHKLQMMRNSVCYSNVVRPGTDRLTGLHACTDEWYFKTTYLRNTLLTDFGNDEKGLYDLAMVFGKPEFFTRGNIRPVHGLHLSPNRTIDSEVNWNVSEYGDKMRSLENSELWRMVSDSFDVKYLLLIEEVIKWCQ